MSADQQQAGSPSGGAGSGDDSYRTTTHPARPTSTTSRTVMPPQAPAPSQKQHQPQQQPRQIALPQHFLVRPGTVKHTASGPATIPGPMVPLLPVDQLPEWMDVLGVPRALAVEQTAGLVNLGTAAKPESAPAFYEVHFHQPPLLPRRRRGARTARDRGGDDVDTCDDSADMGRRERHRKQCAKTRRKHRPRPSLSEDRSGGRLLREAHHDNEDSASSSSGASGSMSGSTTTTSSASSASLSSSQASEHEHEPRLTTNSPSDMNPAAKPFTSTKGAATASRGERLASSSKSTIDSSPNDRHNNLAMKNKNRINNGDPPLRLPSPTVRGSSANPYLYPRPRSHQHHRSSGHGSSGPLTTHPYPDPLTTHPHPADRLLASFYTPSHPRLSTSKRNTNAHAHAHTHTPNHTSSPSHHTKSSSNNNNNHANPGAAPGGAVGGSSIYCRHWCHHGRCKWAGSCRYLHAMPGTAEGLREVGLGDYPAWWRAAVGMALRMSSSSSSSSSSSLSTSAAAAALAPPGRGGEGWDFPLPLPLPLPPPPPGSFGGGGGGGSSKRAMREWREMMMAMMGGVWMPPSFPSGNNATFRSAGRVRTKERERERDRAGDREVNGEEREREREREGERGRKGKWAEKNGSSAAGADSDAEDDGPAPVSQKKRVDINYLEMEEPLEAETEAVGTAEDPLKDGRETAEPETGKLVDV